MEGVYCQDSVAHQLGDLCGWSIFGTSKTALGFGNLREVDTEDPLDTADPTSLDPAAKRKVGWGTEAKKFFLMFDICGARRHKKT